MSSRNFHLSNESSLKGLPNLKNTQIPLQTIKPHNTKNHTQKIPITILHQGPVAGTNPLPFSRNSSHASQKSLLRVETPLWSYKMEHSSLYLQMRGLRWRGT
ncbi:hypothetical protein CEXT_500671 [Caerostris extrusa]|uniref:Uncharacterized protein n=1 Tax=Caerostris extrusa TaxID=172846 RepID=A0AAV4NH95_CAEEX|nr:hypothetical protein CEXT_500671 [Caerostris extrusa]